MSNKVMYVGEEDAWDIIMATLGEDMDSENLASDMRENLKDAYKGLKEVDSSIFRDLEKIVRYYHETEMYNMQDNDEDDDGNSHIFYTLDRLKLFIERQ